jgi:hypothetical protein
MKPESLLLVTFFSSIVGVILGGRAGFVALLIATGLLIAVPH